MNFWLLRGRENKNHGSLGSQSNLGFGCRGEVSAVIDFEILIFICKTVEPSQTRKRYSIEKFLSAVEMHAKYQIARQRYFLIVGGPEFES